MPQTLVGAGREPLPVVERDAALTLSALLPKVVEFPRFKPGREGAAAMELAVERAAVFSLPPLPQTLVGVGREAELLAGRTVSFGLSPLPATVVGLPRFKLGLVWALAVELAPVRAAEVWPPLLPAKVIRP